MVTIIAAVLSGFIGGVGAIAASIFAYYKTDVIERKKKKRDLTYQIFGHRHIFSVDPGDADSKRLAITGINQIPLVFFDNPNVLNAYDNFFIDKSDQNLIKLLTILPEAAGMKAKIQERHVTKYFNVNN